jgi:hypothetical protein
VKAKLFTLLVGLVIGALAGIPAGMNIERDAPLFSNPFAERADREKVIGRIGQETDKAMAATKEGARKALEAGKEKLHEATKPGSE